MMDDKMAELAKRDYEKDFLFESKLIPNYTKHLKTCSKNRKNRKNRK